MRCLHPTALVALALAVLGGPALAENTSLLTAGLGAHYGLSAPATDDDPSSPRHQYGILTRVKVLRFLGLEFSAQLDEHPASQLERILSPRFQLGALLHVVPTDYFSLYAAGGLGAHQLGDVANLDGQSTSLYVGPGLEVFLSEHLTLGVDVRIRTPGPNHLKRQVVDTLSSDPLQDLVSLDRWQATLSLAWYL